MRKMPWAFTASVALGAMTWLMAACGGGGGGGPTQSTVVQGTAAVGSAVSEGTLTLRCAAGTRTATTDATGRYQVDIADLTLPCTMVLTGGHVDGADSPWTLSTVVSSPGVANVTPWTHLVMAKALAADPDTVVPGLSTSDLQRQLTPAKVGEATAAVNAEMAKLLGAEPQAGIDPVTTAFTVSATDGMDQLLQRIMSGLAWSGKTLPQAAQEIGSGHLRITEVPANCRPGVLTGFTGQFNDVPVQVPAGSPGDSGGGAGGGDGGGVGGGSGSGAGGSLGQFLNVDVAVRRGDGSLIGQVVTDAVKGMVTIVPCGYRGPVHVRVQAKADGSSKYFEESTGAYAAFPKDTDMNAVVPAIDKNLGITPLTEAAWQYLQAKYGPEGWKDPGHVIEANMAIKTEFNRFLPKDLQVADITRLPFLVGGGTVSNSISTANQNGVYGIVSSGLARVAGLMRAGDLSPALKLVRQLGRDLCDGTIDLQCNGVPVVVDTADAAYLPSQFGETLNRGLGDVAASCGAIDAGDAAFRVTQISMDYDANVGPNGTYVVQTYHKNQPIYLLRSDGEAFYWRTRDSAIEPLSQQLPALKGLRFSRIFPQMGYDFAAMALDGTFWARTTTSSNVVSASTRPEYLGATTTAGYAVGEEHETLIARMPDGRAKYFPDNARGATGGTDTQVPAVTPFGNIVSVGLGHGLGVGLGEEGFGEPGDYPTFFAVTSDGKTYAWGNDRFGALADQKPVNSGPVTLPTAGPQQVLALKDVAIRQVIGSHGGGFAIDKDGIVYNWGRVTGQSLLQEHTTATDGVSTPVRITGFTEPVQQISCGVTESCAAMTRSGQLLVWGWFGEENPSMPPDMFVPYKRLGITKVPLPAGRRVTYVGASQAMLYAVLDDSRLVVFPRYPDTPEFLDVRQKLPAGSASAVCGR